LEKIDMETKMWSYKLVWDTMFAPNPLFDVLTLATCKPGIRRSPNNKKGMWIAGFTACNIHNAPIFGGDITRCNRGNEKLIYLAQISDILTLDDYWEQYPQKRCDLDPYMKYYDAQWYGDNIYSKNHTDKDGNIIPMPNNGDHEGVPAGERDYHYGKNAIICERFYYFTPDNRMDVPERFKGLVHGGIGQSLKSDGVEEFIAYVADYAAKKGVNNGIVGHVPVCYPEPYITDENEFPDLVVTNNLRAMRKKKGCSK